MLLGDHDYPCTISNSTLSGNHAGADGGAIWNRGALGADGGAIWNRGALGVEFSTLAENTASGDGGAIEAN